MACHAIRHDPNVPPPHPVDSIHSMGAPGVGCGETMNPVLIGIAVAMLLAFVGLLPLILSSDISQDADNDSGPDG